VLYVWLVVGVALVVVVVVVALGRGDAASQAAPDRRVADLPNDRLLTPDDIDALRLPQALRGYRMSDVDGVLDRLARELHSRDERIAALLAGRREGNPPAPAATPPAGDAAD